MGCWGFGIMESDDALDAQEEFEDVFGAKEDLEGNDTSRIPTEAEVLSFFDTVNNDYQVLLVSGYLLMDRSAPMSFKVKEFVCGAVDHELNGHGDIPLNDERRECLQELRVLVAQYPEEGKDVILPPNEGLIDKMILGS